MAVQLNRRINNMDKYGIYELNDTSEVKLDSFYGALQCGFLNTNFIETLGKFILPGRFYSLRYNMAGCLSSSIYYSRHIDVLMPAK